MEERQNGMSKFSKPPHLQARTTRIYSNNSVYAPTGLLMFRCSDKKIDWYLRKELAETIPVRLYDPNHEENARAIRLLFEPRGKGRNRVGDAWYLEDQRDKCVVCGREGTIAPEEAASTYEDIATQSLSLENENKDEATGLTLHHVVPYQYRKEMPLSFKSHGSHDVLAVCVVDHERYERFADMEKQRLCDRYDAPLAGRGWIKYPQHGIVRAAAAALLRYAHNIPQDRINELENTIMKHYGLTERSQISQPILETSLDLRTLEKGEDFLEHGTIVIQQLQAEEGEEGLANFVRFWRQHFLDHMQPKYLSSHWRVDDPVNLIAGEYNPYRPEMDGS